MKVEIKSKEHEQLLEREKILAEVEYEIETPSRHSIKTELSKKLGVNEEHLIVEKIKNNFGRKHADVKVYVYNDPSKIPLIEIKKYVKKNSKKEDVKDEVKAESKEKKKEEIKGGK